MTRSDILLWHLRIYGPCSVAELIRTTRWERAALVSTLSRLRTAGLAERCMRRTYRLTEAGRVRIGRQRAGLLFH